MKRKTHFIHKHQTVGKVFNKKLPLIFLILFSFLFILFLSFFRNMGETETVTEITGRLHTRGAKILDGKNREVILRSINYNELVPVDYKYVKPDVNNLPKICTRWVEPPTSFNARQVRELGFNSVRMVINWSKLETDKPVRIGDGTISHKWNEKYLKALDQTVFDSTENKVAVILDLHQYLWSSSFKMINSDEGFGCSGSGFPEWLYPEIRAGYTNRHARCDFFRNSPLIFSGYSAMDGFTDVWKMLAQRYLQNELVVAADIINEPWSAKDICTPEEMNLNSFYRKIGAAIREINPFLLLIYEESQDNDKNDFALSFPLNLPNSVYSVHLYTTNWIDGFRSLDKFRKRAKLWNVPFFVGEFDGFGYSGNDQPLIVNDPRLTDLEKMMEYLNKERISWAFWSYSGYQSILVPNTYKPKEELMGIIKQGF